MLRGLVLTILVICLTSCTVLPLATPSPILEEKPTPSLVSPTVAAYGTLKGKVTVGPLSPVVRLDQPTSTPPAEVFTTRAINVKNEDTQLVVLKVFFKPDGTYQLELPPGRYIVELVKNGMDRAKELPKTVLLERGQTVILDLDIDTGIR